MLHDRGEEYGKEFNDICPRGKLKGKSGSLQHEWVRLRSQNGLVIYQPCKIYYLNKKLTFTRLNESKFSFTGIKLRSPPLLVSAIQAMKMLKDNYSGYLSSIREPPKEEIAPGDVPVLRAFEDMFPKTYQDYLQIVNQSSSLSFYQEQFLSRRLLTKWHLQNFKN